MSLFNEGQYTDRAALIEDEFREAIKAVFIKHYKDESEVRELSLLAFNAAMDVQLEAALGCLK